MYNLANRKCKSPTLLVPKLKKISKENLRPCRGSNPGPAEPEADMLPSDPAQRASNKNLCQHNKDHIYLLKSSIINVCASDRITKVKIFICDSKFQHIVTLLYIKFYWLFFLLYGTTF